MNKTRANTNRTGPSRRRKTSDAWEIIEAEFLANDPGMRRMIEESTAELEIAQMIYDTREKAGLSQAELAKLVGTTQSVISRLEDADYRGHSLMMLRRIAAALGKRVELKLVPARKAS